MNDIKNCLNCGCPLPPEPPPVKVIMEDGRELKRDGWGELRDKKGRSASWAPLVWALKLAVFAAAIGWVYVSFKLWEMSNH